MVHLGYHYPIHSFIHLFIHSVSQSVSQSVIQNFHSCMGKYEASGLKISHAPEGAANEDDSTATGARLGPCPQFL